MFLHNLHSRATYLKCFSPLTPKERVVAAEYFDDRTDVQCLHRWQKVLNPELVKGPWTKEVR